MSLMLMRFQNLPEQLTAEYLLLRKLLKHEFFHIEKAEETVSNIHKSLY